MILLVVDIGNTNVVCAVFEDDEIVHRIRVKSGRNFWNDFQTLTQFSPEAVMISSVVPELGNIYYEAARNLFDVIPDFVTVKNSGIKTTVPGAKEIGADRLCNVTTAIEGYPLPAVVIDFGTATTYDVIDSNGMFIGGAIAPGIDVSAQNLFESAALLRDAAFQFPSSAIARDTVTNLQSGIMFGAVDAVQGMVERIKSELSLEEITVILTGGFSTIISPGLSIPHTLEPDLTLKGIRLIYLKNSPK
ncbi:MAG: type III pantothenate kinase [Fidelibacterota bacterium]